MGANSSIEWTDHTFNVVWGCQKVSPGCQNCYAETWAKRHGHAVWGPASTTPRRVLSDDYWKQPEKWARAARAAGVRQRVFCSSMADVFEGHPVVADQRERLWPIIEATDDALDWLLLTKRPQNVPGMVHNDWLYEHVGFPPNVWIGTSVEDQATADERIPHLLRVPARVRFLSCEPLLGPVNLRNLCAAPDGSRAGFSAIWPDNPFRPCLSWVICGGESGANARPMQPEWARSLARQCADAGVPFFMKQMGTAYAGKGKGSDCIPDDLQIREFPEVPS